MNKFFELQKRVSAVQLFLASGLVSIASLMMVSATASAASGNVTFQLGDWHCASGGKIVSINWASVNPSGYTVGPTNGSKVSIPVWFNTRNVAYASFECQYHTWYGGTYNVPVSFGNEGFWPTHAGQTIYL